MTSSTTSKSPKQTSDTEKLDGASVLLGLFDPLPSSETAISVPRHTAAVPDSIALGEFFIPATEGATPKTRGRSLINDTSPLVAIFDPLSKSSVSTEDDDSLQNINGADNRVKTIDTVDNNKSLDANEFSKLSQPASFGDSTMIDQKSECTPLLSATRNTIHCDDNAPKRGIFRKPNETNSFLPSICETPVSPSGEQRTLVQRSPSFAQMKCGLASFGRTVGRELLNPTTWIGSVMFVLFQIVFSLTMGAAITRPHATKSMLGLFTKVASLGIMVGGPIFFITLGGEIPALYPTGTLIFSTIALQ